MSQRDILRELHEGNISPAEVQQLYDQTTPSEVFENWGLSQTEYTAFGHGADFENLATWRYQGWPTRCSICSGQLPTPEEYGWFVWDDEEQAPGNYGGRLGIVHIECLPAAPENVQTYN